ncbi:hypothetical protein [uncultured Kriegella sp.]|uniref:hypothetical protein n=1 Tax=uncultured Kriegella sp. TaxID=1798910 RepID=UPI0030DDB27E|tara:strand:- start:315180 stop:316421 length:1242 start_codon:yes stop_codon:yes gene_type:complete
MKKKLLRFCLFGSLTGILLASCSKENDEADLEILTTVNAKTSLTQPGEYPVPLLAVDLPDGFRTNDIPFDIAKAVEPSACSPTPFDDVINASIASNLDGLGLEWYSLYAEMNFVYTLTDNSHQYFGEKGQYTFYVYYLKWKLERFWKMRREVSVRGQHNATLNNFDKIVEILTFWYGLNEAEAADYADFFINYVNIESTFLVETPLLSFDAFAIALEGDFDQGDIIVLGDGIIELMAKTGIDKRVILSGILSHEWAHQIQFNNFETWYPNGAADNVPEATRTTELEADFFTGYYLTHQRGGTHNWKRAEQFLDLFYNIGDCSFDNDGHHGTPNQRMEAAKQGYELGQKGFYNCSKTCKGFAYGKIHRHYFSRGHALDEHEVHTAFLDKLDEIINGPWSSEVEEDDDEEEEYYY